MGSLGLWTSYTGFIMWGLMPLKDFLNWQRLRDSFHRGQVWALRQVNLRLLLALGQHCFEVLCCCLKFTIWYRQDSYRKLQPDTERKFPSSDYFGCSMKPFKAGGPLQLYTGFLVYWVQFSLVIWWLEFSLTKLYYLFTSEAWLE